MAHANQQSAAVDFRLSDQGSISILNAVSLAGREWADDNLPEDRMTWGRDGTVIEHRYVGDIVYGIALAGLTVVES